MASPLKRSADEILEALDSAAHQMKRALRERQTYQAERIRDQNRAVRQTDGDMDSPNPDVNGNGPGNRPAPSDDVHELDIGTYRDLRDRAVVGDGMQHDHIPSVAALLRRAERDKGEALTPAEKQEIYNSALCIEIRNDLHYASRTYGGRNTQDQINADADDLLKAANNDIDVLQANLQALGEYDSATIRAVTRQMRELARLRFG
jgi:hypothetical protein